MVESIGAVTRWPYQPCSCIRRIVGLLGLPPCACQGKDPLSPKEVEVSQASELGEALASCMFKCAGRANVGHKARQTVPQAGRWEFVIALATFRYECESALPRESGTIRIVGRYVRDLFRNGAQGSYPLTRISEWRQNLFFSESVCMCDRVGLVVSSIGTGKAVTSSIRSPSGNCVSKTVAANFHQFTIRPQAVVIVSPMCLLMSPSVFGRPLVNMTSQAAVR